MDTRTAGLFQNIRTDYAANGRDIGSQGFWALLVYRFGRWRYGIRLRVLRAPFSVLYRILYKLIQITTGIELPCEARIGRNFVIDHSGGIVISGYAVFGDNCRIRNGVTVGLARVEDPCAPVIGDNVDIGAGAKILGAIRIGSNVRIGANAVVIDDMPGNGIAVGIPAVFKPHGSGSRVFGHLPERELPWNTEPVPTTGWPFAQTGGSSAPAHIARARTLAVATPAGQQSPDQS